MPRGRPRKYPWDLWLDGERHVLNSAADFQGVAVRSLRQQVLNEAVKRGVEVSTRIAMNPRGDGVDYLEVKMRPPAPAKRMDWDAFFKKLPRTLFEGKDYDCSTEAMRVRIYQAAQRRDSVDVRIETRNTQVSVYPVREKPVTETAPVEGA